MLPLTHIYREVTKNMRKYLFLILSFFVLIFAGTNSYAEKIKVGLSAFQDVHSIFVGMDQGYYADEGIELDIVYTDWPGANELGAADQVEIWTTSDADVVIHNARGLDSTLAFPLYWFGGGGLMFDPKLHNWTTYETFLSENGGDRIKAITDTLVQTKGAKVGVSSGGAEYSAFILMLKSANLDPADWQIIDLAQEDMPPALLTGSIDIQISGIPQRLAVLKEGMGTLIDQRAVCESIAHCGFGAKRSWLDANADLAKRLQRVILRTTAFIKENPDHSFPIIAENLRKQGTPYEAEWLYGVWDNMEYFVNGVDWWNTKVVPTDGTFYWKDRFAGVIDSLQAEDRVPNPYPVALEDLNRGVEIMAALTAEGFKTSQDK